jgi:hypothetical protein
MYERRRHFQAFADWDEGLRAVGLSDRDAG